MSESVGRPNIQMIAERVGVSKATVSRALRGLPGQSEATRQRVVEAAKAMGYAKNPLVTALMTNLRFRKSAGHSPVLAFVHCLPWGPKLHPNMILMCDRAREHASSLGYRLEEFHLHEPGMTPNRLLEILRARGIRGAIFEHFWSKNVFLDIDLAAFATVAIGYTLQSPNLHRIVIDQFSSIFIAAAKLGELGYRRLGLAIPRTNESYTHFKREAALHVLHREMAGQDRVPMHAIAETMDENAFLSWYDRFRPDSILTIDASLHQTLTDRGIRIPNDLGFVFLAWHPNNKGWAGIDPNWGGAGIAAVNQVVDQMKRNEFGVPAKPLVTLIGGEWVDGGTVREVSSQATKVH